MAIVMKMKYVDELSGGRKRFRRRWPKDVADKRGETVFQKPFTSTDGRAFLLEHEQFVAEFDREVSQKRLTADEWERTSPTKKFRAAKREAARLWAGSSGDEYGIECALAEHAIETGDNFLYRAIMDPNAPEPEKTLADAFDLYIDEKLDSSSGRNARNRIERVKKRLDAAIGNLAEIPLKSLKREHGRALQAHLRSATKKNGASLSVATTSYVRKFWLFRSAGRLASKERIP
ncbi:hypothetical protein [Donghicola sp.]|jgi:hypothetical protein|uniref:hypothetical protein n=1 Tax=Donghicola sp. TaxID=1929294 RepID=UPI0025F38DDD|nr:hypothetical protein [Donghicola sp.]MCT4576028.1 hypothetical protein [Donghicola sp.]